LEATKQDKRAIVRRRTQQLVYLELGRENGGVMLNLSEQGCGFQAITPVKCGETRFAFQINGGRRIAGDAEVVWADEAGIMGGLRFLNLPAEAHREIRVWLNETNAPPEPGFVPLGATADAGSLRARGVGGSSGAAAAAAGVRVAEQEPPPAPSIPPPAWLNLRAGNYAPVEDPRHRASFHRDDGLYGATRQGSSGAWRVIAITATIVALAALGIVYQRDVGTSLIWVGETLAGKTKASAVEPEKQAAPAIPPPAAESSSRNIATDPPPDQNVSERQERTGEPRNDAAGIGAVDAPGGVTNGGIGRGESVLERQGVPPKTEAAFTAGDSVESLWGAVQAGSVAAEVSLAERFARGEGVNKNCEQAKVLMKAAADRGNREARLRLYEMETGGCR
jgi:hypothetical protein